MKNEIDDGLAALDRGVVGRRSRFGGLSGAEWGLFGTALLVRLVVVMIMLQGGVGKFYDKVEPFLIASHLAAGEGFATPYRGVPAAPTAQQPPLYPALLWLLLMGFGPTPLALGLALLVNILAGAAVAVLLVQLGQKYFTTLVGWLAGVVWAIWPHAAMEGLPLGNYALCALLVTAAALVAPRILRYGSRRELLALGAGAGVAALLNPIVVMVLAAFMVVEAIFGKWRWNLAFVGVGALVIVAPWTVRNVVVLHRFVPIRDNFGMELWLGNHPGMVGTVDLSGEYPWSDPTRYAALGEIPFMEAQQAEALRFIRQEPGLFVARVARRVVEFWSAPFPRWWGPLSLLAWFGALLALSQRNEMGVFVVAVMALVPVTYYVTHMFPTYRHPIEPLMFIVAAHALVTARHAVLSRVRPG